MLQVYVITRLTQITEGNGKNRGPQALQDGGVFASSQGQAEQLKSSDRALNVATEPVAYFDAEMASLRHSPASHCYPETRES
jgi:hypothetical protein